MQIRDLSSGEADRFSRVASRPDVAVAFSFRIRTPRMHASRRSTRRAIRAAARDGDGLSTTT